jgi:hypothetical protein
MGDFLSKIEYEMKFKSEVERVLRDKPMSKIKIRKVLRLIKERIKKGGN